MSDMSARPAIPHDKQPDSTIEASLPSMNDGTLPPDASSLSEPPEGNAVSQTPDQTCDLPSDSVPPSDQTAMLSEQVMEVHDQTCDLPSDSMPESDQTAFLPDNSGVGLDRTQHEPGAGEDASQVDLSDRTGEWSEYRSVEEQVSHSSPAIHAAGKSPPEGGTPRKPPPARPTHGVGQAPPTRQPRPAALSALSPQTRTAPPPEAPVITGYEMIKELGRGAMGVVYKARQLALNRMVALKMVLAGQHAGAKMLMRFQLEAEAVARLQHPNIVQIYEIGEQDGCPFFALEFVEGGTLSDRIIGKPIPPAEAAFVVRQLALAMGHAHRCGVVHRDLKPANILLGASEADAATQPTPLTRCVPKVTDFGLAKRLEDSSHTQAGSIMGTPSYMAPEQAEGHNDLVGPPADIYALGAILYDLLTGRPPFQGKTILDTLQQVKKLEPVSPRKLCPRLPADLETICLKCLEKAPDRRYASAEDLAEDLRRFLAGEPIRARQTPMWERAWKYCKRRPAMAGMVAFASVTALGLGVAGYVVAGVENRLRQTAETERQRAEANFQSAQEAVDVMLTRIGEERLEHEPRMEQVRRDLLEAAIRFYDRFLNQDSGNPELRWQTAKAFRRVADIRLKLGQYDLAEKAYESARGMFDELAEQNPLEPKFRYDLAGTWNGLGNLHMEETHSVEAENAFSEARTLLEKLVNESQPLTPDGQSYRQGLATSCYQLAKAKQALRQVDQALPLFQEALDLQDQLRTVDSEQPVYRRELARTLDSKGLLLRQMGNTPQAEISQRQALALLQELNDQGPNGHGMPEDRQALAIAHGRLGSLLQTSNPPLAEKEYRDAVKLGEELKDDFPTIPVYRQDLAASYNNLGITLLAQGQREKADEAMRKGLALKDKLAGDFPRKPDFRRDLATTLINHGVLMLINNRLPESETAYRRAADLLAGLVKEAPTFPDYQHQQGLALLNLASNLQLQGKPREAEKGFREALGFRKDLAERYSKVPAYQHQWARAELMLATLRQGMTDGPAKERLQEAETLYRSAATKLKALVAAHSDEVDYLVDLASCLNNLGDLLRATNRLDNALETLEEGTRVLAVLVGKDPNRPMYKQQQGRMLHLTGVVLTARERLLAAEDAHRQALAIREKLVNDNDKDPAYRLDLASSYGEIAITQARRNKAEPALENFRKAVSILHEGGQDFVDRPDFLRAEAAHQGNLALLLKFLGKDKEWKKCQERIQEINQTLPKKKMP